MKNLIPKPKMPKVYKPTMPKVSSLRIPRIKNVVNPFRLNLKK